MWREVVLYETGFLLLIALPFLIMGLMDVDPQVILAVTAVLVVIVLLGGVALFRHYRPMMSDRDTHYDTGSRRVVHHAALVMEEAGLEYDLRRGEDHPDLPFDVEFHVRSEGFRVGIKEDMGYMGVYVGPVRDFNERTAQRVMDLFDKHLWKE